MKIRSTGPVWFFVVGIPILALCFFGLLALLVRWDWMAAKCADWVHEMNSSV